MRKEKKTQSGEDRWRYSMVLFFVCRCIFQFFIDRRKIWNFEKDKKKKMDQAIECA